MSTKDQTINEHDELQTLLYMRTEQQQAVEKAKRSLEMTEGEIVDALIEHRAFHCFTVNWHAVYRSFLLDNDNRECKRQVER